MANGTKRKRTRSSAAKATSSSRPSKATKRAPIRANTASASQHGNSKSVEISDSDEPTTGSAAPRRRSASVGEVSDEDSGSEEERSVARSDGAEPEDPEDELGK